jgi:hypothetical protein
MYKQLTAFLLLAAFSLQMLNRAVVYIDYYANTAAYAKNCENKAMPLMHCNGKCQMMKKLKEQEKKESQAPERRSFNDEVIAARSFFVSINYFFLASTSAYNIYSAKSTVDMPHSFFHPPGA